MKKRIFEKRLNRFLECYDYRIATFLGAYGVYKVYEPDRSHLGIYIGLPELVMVNGRNIFMVDGEESADILQYFDLKNGVACACDYCEKENCDDCDAREQRDACNNAETEPELCHEQDATLTPRRYNYLRRRQVRRLSELLLLRKRQKKSDRQKATPQIVPRGKKIGLRLLSESATQTKL